MNFSDGPSAPQPDRAAALAAPARDRARWLLPVEMAILYFGGPLLVVSGLWPKRLEMVLLLLLAVVTVVIARRGVATHEDLGVGPAGRQGLRPTLRAGVSVWVGAFAATAAVRWALGLVPLPLLLHDPLLFAVIVLIYAGSVAAQEFLFRSYFFWRYRELGSPMLLFVLNVLAFAWLHVVFGSVWSVVLTLLGGVLFTALYQRYRSFIGVCIVHALFGLAIFAMGYGRYFVGGTSVLAQRLNASHAAVQH